MSGPAATENEIDEQAARLAAEGYLIYFPEKETLCSKPLATFLGEFKHLIDFFFFSIEMVSTADEAFRAITKAMIPLSRTDEEKELYQRRLESGSSSMKRLTQFSWINSRNLVTTTVDLYLWYLSEIVQAAMLKHPNLLKSSEQVSIEEIIDLTSREELIAFLIDRKVNSLSYGGFAQSRST